MKPKLLIATRNPGKQREIRPLLADAPFEIVFPDDRGLWEQRAEASIEDAAFPKHDDEIGLRR